MSKVEPLYDARYTIDHAKRRIDELQTKWQGFVKSSPYAIRVERDIEACADVHKVVLAEPLPHDFPGIAFEIVNGLRSALDQAGCSIARSAGNKGAHAHFPFGDSKETVERKCGPKARSREIPKVIFDLMVTFQPYKGGDDVLWSLNKLANTPKHETILKIEPVMSFPSAEFQTLTITGPSQWPPVWDSTKNEAILARVPIGQETKYNLQIGVAIEFADVAPLRGYAADTVLHAMASKVESIVNALEAEGRRIGIIH